MAARDLNTIQYTSEDFVESAGAVLTKLSTRQICIVHHRKRDEYLLAKGRRNIGESRHTAAIREGEEETGYRCRPLPVKMTTRAPPAVELKFSRDEPIEYEDICEPFMVTHRTLKGNGLKFIWWYAAAIDAEAIPGGGEAQFETKLLDFEEAVEVLAY